MSDNTGTSQLRRQARKMRHAAIHDRQYDADGKLLVELTHHYLTCTACKIEREAEALKREQ